MPSYQPPLKNSAYVFYISLVGQANTKTFQANPTLAAGDVRIAIDDAAPVNISALPIVDADFTKRVKVTLSAAEMQGDRVTVVFSDVAGNEWCDLAVDIATTTTQYDDIPTAQEVWAYTPRTLTQTAAQVTTTMGSGGNLTVTKSVTFVATLTGITLPVGWDKLYFTAKQSPNYPDSTALIQLLLSNPGLPGDGLLVINQKVATPANGNLVVAGSAITITLTDDATALLSSGDSAPYDIKVVVDGASVLLATGKVTITGTPTASI